MASSSTTDVPSADAVPYCLLIINLDAITFRPEFVRNGAQGGREASEKLRAGLQKYTKGPRKGPRARLVVRVYGDLRPLPTAFMSGFAEMKELAWVDYAEEEKASLMHDLFALARLATCFRAMLAGVEGLDADTLELDSTKICKIMPATTALGAQQFSEIDLSEVFISHVDLFTPVPPKREEPWKSDRPTEPTPRYKKTIVIKKRPHAVPVNDAGKRVDELLPVATGPQWRAYYGCLEQMSPCSNAHLRGDCKRGDDCPYSHQPLSQGTLLCLRHVLRKKACSKGSSCRKLACPFAHHCIEEACARAGRKVVGCRVPFTLHGVNPRVARMEPATISRTVFRTNVKPDDDENNEGERAGNAATVKAAPAPSGHESEEDLITFEDSDAGSEENLIDFNADDDEERWMREDAEQQSPEQGSYNENAPRLDEM